MMNLKKILSSVWPATLWSALIFILLSLPGSMFPSEPLFPIPHFDKVVHAILFGFFVWFWIAYFRNNHHEKEHTLVKLVIISCAYAFAMEFVQKNFIPNRDFDIYDGIAGCAGALLAFVLIERKIPSKQ